jgi:hypothetical protein
MRRLLGLALLLTAASAVTSRVGTARTSSLTNRYDSNYDATWRAINALNAQFTPAQLAFLQGLGTMTAPTSYPLDRDPSTGASWVTGERDYVNASTDLANDLVAKLIRQGFMTA